MRPLLVTFTRPKKLARYGPRLAREGTPASYQLRVLVVEDDARLRRAFVLVLEALGHAVEACADGAGAEDALEGGDFDAAFVDVTLRAGSGLEVAAAIRALPPERRPRVIGLSGWASNELLRSAFDVFLEKPVSEADLRAVLDEVAAVRDRR